MRPGMISARSFILVACFGMGLLAPRIVLASGQASDPQTLCGCGTTEPCVERNAQLVIDVTDRGNPACPSNGSDAKLLLRTAKADGTPVVFCAVGNGCDYAYDCANSGCNCAEVPPLTEGVL